MNKKAEKTNKLDMAYAVFDEYEQSPLRLMRPRNLKYIKKLRDRKKQLQTRKGLHEMLLELGSIQFSLGNKTFNLKKMLSLGIQVDDVIIDKRKIPNNLLFSDLTKPYKTKFPFWTLSTNSKHFFQVCAEFYSQLLDIYEDTAAYSYSEAELSANPIIQTACKDAVSPTSQADSGIKELARNTVLCGMVSLGEKTNDSASALNDDVARQRVKAQLQNTHSGLSDADAETLTEYLYGHGIVDGSIFTANDLLNQTLFDENGRAWKAQGINPSIREPHPISYHWENGKLVASVNLDVSILLCDQVDPPTYLAFDPKQQCFREFSDISIEANEQALEAPSLMKADERKQKLQPIVSVNLKMCLDLQDGKVNVTYPNCGVVLNYTGLRHRPPAIPKQLRGNTTPGLKGTG